MKNNPFYISDKELSDLRKISCSVFVTEIPILFEELHSGKHCDTCKNKDTNKCVKKKR